MSNIIQIDLGEVENSCFIVMPFNALFQSEYENIIRPALSELNITCIRGDEIYSKQRIMDDIWSSIRSCRFVLAELTGRNPNVLYEIGLAHAIGKPVIIITRNGEDVPFDLKALRYLFYDVNDPFWGENLKKGIQSLVNKVLENPEIEYYLQGITKSKPIVFPDLKNTPPLKKVKEMIPNISGEWVGSFNLNDYHEVTLSISQNDEKLSANAVITFGEDNMENVVQQIMVGSINSKEANLIGVNYSFLKRENVANYYLDSFTINNFNENLLLGFTQDSQGKKTGELRLARNFGR